MLSFPSRLLPKIAGKSLLPRGIHIPSVASRKPPHFTTQDLTDKQQTALGYAREIARKALQKAPQSSLQASRNPTSLLEETFNKPENKKYLELFLEEINRLNPTLHFETLATNPIIATKQGEATIHHDMPHRKVGTVIPIILNDETDIPPTVFLNSKDLDNVEDRFYTPKDKSKKKVTKDILRQLLPIPGYVGSIVGPGEPHSSPCNPEDINRFIDDGTCEGNPAAPPRIVWLITVKPKTAFEESHTPSMYD